MFALDAVCWIGVLDRYFLKAFKSLLKAFKSGGGEKTLEKVVGRDRLFGVRGRGREYVWKRGGKR